MVSDDSRPVPENVVRSIAGEIVEEQIRTGVTGAADKTWLLRSACSELPLCVLEAWREGNEEPLRECLLRRIRNLAERCYYRTVQYSMLSRKLINRTRWLIDDPAQAEDIVQATLERAVKGSARYRGDCTYETWVTSILFNVIRDQSRGGARNLVPSASLSGLMDSGPALECAGPLAAFLYGPSVTPEKKVMEKEIVRKLFDRFRVLLTDSYSYRAIYLTFVEARPPEEVARILGVTVPHYYRILAGARKKLRGSPSVRKLLEMEGIHGRQSKGRSRPEKR